MSQNTIKFVCCVLIHLHSSFYCSSDKTVSKTCGGSLPKLYGIIYYKNGKIYILVEFMEEYISEILEI